MFWKRVKAFRALRFKSLSLVTKLMLLYSVSTLGLLGAIALFLYPTLTKILVQANTPAANLSVECFEKIIISLLMATLAALVFGHVISRNGLKRLREFEITMKKISAHSLDERILLNEWPKELRNLGQRFNEMLNRIQSSFIQLSQFSSDIAHELRTPLHNLKTSTELALLSGNSHQEYQELLESNMKEYQHLSKLIENMLFIARSDHGQITLNKTSVAIQQEIQAVCDYYQALADEKKIMLICNGEAEIKVDTILFRRVFSNLLSNALRYTPNQGRICIDIHKRSQEVEIRVQDTGIGISNEHLSQLFNRFYRVDTSRSLHSGGLGLGLSIVKSIVALHGGHIKIESKINTGTSVYIQLPVSI